MATVNNYPLEQKKILKKFLIAMTGPTLLAIAVFISNILFLKGIFDVFVPYVLVAFFVVALWQAWYEFRYFEDYFYDLRDNVFIIRKGVITPREIIMPYGKLQDVYVDQDWLDRLFGLFDVHVSTATFLSGQEAHIDGLNVGNAAKLRELILSKI